MGGPIPHPAAIGIRRIGAMADGPNALSAGGNGSAIGAGSNAGGGGNEGGADGLYRGNGELAGLHH